MRRMNTNRSKKNRARRRGNVAVKTGGRSTSSRGGSRRRNPQGQSLGKERRDFGYIETDKDVRGNRDIETDVRTPGTNIENDEMDRSMDVTEKPPRRQESVEGRPDQLAAEDEDVERMQGEESSDDKLIERSAEPEGEVDESDEERRSGRLNPEEEDELRRRRNIRPDDRTNTPE
jgi:hypothetical protein